MRDGTDSESDGSLVPDGQLPDDAVPAPGTVPAFDGPEATHSGHVFQNDVDTSACDDACGSMTTVIYMVKQIAA